MAIQQLRSVYQINVTLNYVQPPVWRRILVLSTTSLPGFHSAIQFAMGWTDSHLHMFISSTGHYGLPDDEFGDGNTIDENGYKVSDLMVVEGDSIMYEYDFGDGWLHQVVLEKVLPFEAGFELPQCIDGARNCPPEDVGGPPGYENFLEAVQDKNHDEHEDFIDWIGGGFDPEEFDVVVTNQVLYDHTGNGHS